MDAPKLKVGIYLRISIERETEEGGKIASGSATLFNRWRWLSQCRPTR